MLSIIFPTRKRPANVIRFVDSIFATADHVEDIELCIYLDDDDSDSIPALEKIAEKISTQAITGNLKIGSHMYNELYRIANGDIFMFAADDITFGTNHWDTMVKNVFDGYDDKILLVYGDDGFQNGRIATHGFIHNNWIETVGYVLPPKLASSYTDEWVTDLAIRVNRKFYFPQLKVEHFHPAAGKAPTDETYSKRTEMPGDLGILYRSLEADRVHDAQKLKEFIDNYAKPSNPITK